MFWLKEYCKLFSLELKDNKIFENKKQIGYIDLYEEVIYIKGKKYLPKHLACTLMENFKLHGDD